jgi:hypothetical protein
MFVNSTAVKGTCNHKQVAPVLPIEWFSFFFYTIWAVIVTSGGTSGGGTFVPLLRVINHFNTKDAIGISNAT